MVDLIDVRADAINPGERICLGGSLILVTDVSLHAETAVVDLHTEYGPALRLTRHDLVAVVAEMEQITAA
jgi:hypothetical protein